MTYDVAIIGAGIVGAACAREFVQAGLKVAVLEDQVPGGGATAAGMGHVVVMDDSEAQFALTKYSRDLWDEVLPQLPDSVEHLPCGTLWVAADADEMYEVRRKHNFYEDRGVETEVLDSQSLEGAEPHLREGLAGGLLVPGDSVVYPPCAARWLLSGSTLIQARATTLHEGAITCADGSTVITGTVVNACGAWAAQLSPELAVPIAPRKGHLLITDRYPGFLRHQLVELGYLKSAHATTADSVAFNAQPRRSGQLLIGSSRQFGADYPAIDRQILSAMLKRATEYMPGLAALSSLRAWTGFRAATPDKLPLIGLVPGYRNVYVAAGHEGLGITTSLGTGRLLADQVLGRTPRISPEPYLPERASIAHA